MRIATFGDVLLDVIVRLEEPLAPGGDVRAANRAGAGGQAANVAAWAAELGAEARCIAKRGDDPAGELVARELAARGVELVGPVAAGSTGVVVSVVETATGARLRPRGGTDVRARGARRGVGRVRRPPPLRLRARAGADRGGRAPGGAARAGAGRTHLGRRRGVDRDPRYGPVRFRELLDELAPDVLFATEAEWELLGGAYLTAPTGVLKRGARGCTVFTEDAKLDFEALEVDVVDPTGAGDALAAGFLGWAARSRRLRGAGSRRLRGASRK